MTQPTGLDAMTMLATGVHAQPGVYAVLLGSGVSTAAGIPTGWGVIQDLVRRVAIAQDPKDADGVALAGEDAEAWWERNGDGRPLDYSELLEHLVPTGPARQGTLSAYFEADEEDRAEGRKMPTAAHHAIAALVRRGSVRVVITTNFDRLMEQALDAAGVSAQIIHRADQIPAMTPLTHATATVIKVHGDYHDQDMRNTVTDLSDYPAELSELLDRVFDEHGLVISGWSADWDKALVAAVEGRRSRRYPLYWDSRCSKGHMARNLLAQHRGAVVVAQSADELFTGLLERVEALDRLAEPPLTTAMAMARLKRYLPDPLRRIDLQDLVMDAADRVVEQVTARPLGGGTFEEVFADHRTAAEPLLRLLFVGAWNDEDDAHASLWVDVLQRLLDAREIPQGSFNDVAWAAQHYPALLALWTMGIAAVQRKREAFFLRLLTEPHWRYPFGAGENRPAAEVLAYWDVLDHNVVNGLPRWNKTTWIYPASHLVRADLAEVVGSALRGEGQYKSAVDAVEYRVGLGGYKSSGRMRLAGEFIGERGWTDNVPRTETAFREAAARSGSNWPWWDFLECDTAEAVEAFLETYRGELAKHQRWG